MMTLSVKFEPSPKFNYWGTPRLAVGTKPMGFPKGRSGSSSLWSTTGFKPRGRFNLIGFLKP